MSRFSRNIWIVSLVSLCTDLASEMLYPVWPVYLASIGYQVWAIGFLEGLAEMVAGLGKAYFGYLSDRSGNRKSFISWGYGLSALSKPLMAVSSILGIVFLARLADRMGKGIRSAPRDALLASESTSKNRASVFGLHRSMDTLGAVLGPLAALTYLNFHPGHYAALFLLAAIPGALAVMLTGYIRESHISKPRIPRPSIPDFLKFWKNSSESYKQFARPLLLIALVNSSDVFLLLKARQAGLNDSTVILLYIGYNLVYSLLAYPAGKLADWLGHRTVLIAGWMLFAGIYTGFAFANQLEHFILLFSGYGIVAACTDGQAKAWLTELVPAEQRGTALGNYLGLLSIAGFIASLCAGLLWNYFSSTISLLTTAFVTGISCIFMLLNSSTDPSKPN